MTRLAHTLPFVLALSANLVAAQAGVCAGDGRNRLNRDASAGTSSTTT